MYHMTIAKQHFLGCFEQDSFVNIKSTNSILATVQQCHIVSWKFISQHLLLLCTHWPWQFLCVHCPMCTYWDAWSKWIKDCRFSRSRLQRSPPALELQVPATQHLDSNWGKAQSELVQWMTLWHCRVGGTIKRHQHLKCPQMPCPLS